MLTFIKRTATSWQHDNGTVKSSFGGGIPITNDTENTIVFQLPNGTNFPIKSVLITDCKIIDKTDGDAEYTFATTTEFWDKLEELNYPFINTGGGGGGAGTNLGYTPSATNGIVTSSTGMDATIPLADGTDAGLSENNVTDSEKSFLLTAGGLDLSDYAKTDVVIVAIGEALTDAETYTDNALENYTNTTDLNTLLGTKADKDGTFQLIFHCAASNIGDNATLYMGGSNNLILSTTNNRFETAGITSSKLRATIFIYNTGTLGTSEDLSITLMNITQSTEITLTTTAKTNSTSYNHQTGQLTFAITAEDNLAIRINSTAIATNPTNVLFGVRVMQIK